MGREKLSELSEKHILVRDYILKYQAEHGERPLIKVIMSECGIKSSSTAYEIVNELKAANELFGPVYKAKAAEA